MTMIAGGDHTLISRKGRPYAEVLQFGKMDKTDENISFGDVTLVAVWRLICG